MRNQPLRRIFQNFISISIVSIVARCCFGAALGERDDTQRGIPDVKIHCLPAAAVRVLRRTQPRNAACNEPRNLLIGLRTLFLQCNQC